MVAMIDRAAGEMAGLADRMAGFAETPEFDRSPSNLSRIIERMVEQNGDLIPAHIETEVALSDSLPNVSGDEASLQQACWNIWNNAIDAMPQEGKLTCQTSTHWVRSQPDGQQNGAEPSRFVRVRVTDTGKGMDAETRAAMFVPFFTTKSGKCRGLGATAAYETVRECNGFIEVSSDPGSGTCVDLYFLALEDAALPAPTPNDPPSREISRKLLVVDDDYMVRMATQRMLAHLGYDSIAASGGEEALAIYKQSAADIGAIILDVTMPGLSGLETLRLLREIDSQVKVVVYTGDPQAPGLLGLEPQAVSTVLPKPFRIEQLAQAMEQALA
jgi:CheY-like chemotaxis protein